MGSAQQSYSIKLIITDPQSLPLLSANKYLCRKRALSGLCKTASPAKAPIPPTLLTPLLFWHAEVLPHSLLHSSCFPCRIRDVHVGCPLQGQQKQVCWGHLKYFLPRLYICLRHSKRLFSAQMCLSNGKNTFRKASMAVGKNAHPGEDPKWWPQMCPVDSGHGRRRAGADSISVQLQHAV